MLIGFRPAPAGNLLRREIGGQDTCSHRSKVGGKQFSATAKTQPVTSGTEDLTLPQPLRNVGILPQLAMENGPDLQPGAPIGKPFRLHGLLRACLALQRNFKRGGGWRPI